MTAVIFKTVNGLTIADGVNIEQILSRLLILRVKCGLGDKNLDAVGGDELMPTVESSELALDVCLDLRSLVYERGFDPRGHVRYVIGRRRRIGVRRDDAIDVPDADP